MMEIRGKLEEKLKVCAEDTLWEAPTGIHLN